MKVVQMVGALGLLKVKIEDDFLLLNGNIIFDVDCKCFLEYHKKQGNMAAIFTHPNSHPYNSGIIIHIKDTKVKDPNIRM